MKKKYEGGVKLYNPVEIYLTLVMLAVARKSQRCGQPDKAKARITILRPVSFTWKAECFEKLQNALSRNSVVGIKQT